MATANRGKLVAPDVRDRCVDIVQRMGLFAAARALGMRHGPLTRIMAGLTVYPGTEALARQGLERIDQKTAADTGTDTTDRRHRSP